MKEGQYIDHCKSVFENSAVAITVADEKGRFISWNKFAEKLLGTKELYMKPVKSFYPKEEWNKILKAIKKDKKTSWHHFETQIIGKNKRPTDVEISISFLIKKNKIVRSIGIARDISKRKGVERELEKEKSLLYALMDNIPDSIYFKDQDSKFIAINKAKAKKLKLRTPSEAQGKTDFDFYKDQLAKPAYADERNIISSKKPLISKVEKIVKPDGSLRWVSATKAPVKSKDGKVTGIVGISRDITREKIAEDELRKARDELESRVQERTKELIKTNRELADEIRKRKKEETKLRQAIERQKQLEKIKTEFLSVTSHELKTPITPMKAQLQMLLAGYFGKLTSEEKASIDIVLRNTENLDVLISDILDISKIESGNMKFMMSKADIGKVIKNVIETIKYKSDEKNVQLVVETDKIKRFTMDKNRIRQVLLNLINNAIKFTDTNGKIKISMHNQGNGCLIKVQDSGVGIPKSVQKDIFNPFIQVDSSRSRNHEGTGLGLAICRGIVEQHQGKIWVESKMHKGSTFFVFLPYKHSKGEGQEQGDILHTYKERMVVTTKHDLTKEFGAVVVLLLFMLSGFLYFSNPGGVFYEECSISSRGVIACKDSFATSGAVKLLVRNELNEPIRITGATVRNAENKNQVCKLSDDAIKDLDLVSDKSAILVLDKGVTCSDMQFTDDEFQGELEIAYQKQDLTTKKIRGNVKVKYINNFE